MAATTSTMPFIPHSKGNTVLPYRLNTMYDPSHPNSVPSTTPTTPATSDSSSASTASERRSCPRVMPMARNVADSRVRSITDRLSVFATPISAMSTATAISATRSISIELMMVSHCARSATGPVMDTVESYENTS